MIEMSVDIPTADGAMNAYIFHPDRDGPHPVVILYMDALGLREELSDMSRRIAAVGYYVLMPNLYYRSARSIDVDGRRMHDPAYAERAALMWKYNRALTNAMVDRDTEAMLKFLDTEDAARKGRIGMVGYCMSGRFVFHAAGAHPDRVAASASIYGAGLVTERDDSPHLSAGDIQGEMYFACAATDAYAPPEILEKLRGVIDETGINASIEVYPDTHHGFAFPNRPVYHKAGAERHWERLFSLFRRNLQAS